MIVTYKTLHHISYPAYPLGSDNWDSKDGLLFLDGLLLDDKNQEGKTLGVRRLQTPFTDLYPLRRAAEAPLGLLKSSAGPYIDNAGKLFYYEKTIMAQLKYYKISKVISKDTCSILKIKGVNFPMKVKRPPPSDCTWAGLLHISNIPWLLYEYSSVKNADTRRKI